IAKEFHSGKMCPTPSVRENVPDILLFKERVLVQSEYRVEPHEEGRERIVRVRRVSEFEWPLHEGLSHLVEHAGQSRCELVVSLCTLGVLGELKSRGHILETSVAQEQTPSFVVQLLAAN